MRRAVKALLGVCGAMFIVACRAPGQARDGQARATMFLDLHVKVRPVQPTAGVAVEDSATVLLTVDSIAGDTLFGTYSPRLDRLGLRVGRVTPGPQVFVAKLTNDSIWFELTPDAADAGLEGHGVMADSGYTGVWITDATHARGMFRLTRTGTAAGQRVPR